MVHKEAETGASRKGVDCGAQLPIVCFLRAARKQAVTRTPAPTTSFATRSLAILNLLSTTNAHNTLHAPVVSKTRRKSLSLRHPNTLSSLPHCLGNIATQSFQRSLYHEPRHKVTETVGQ
ncbi:hypothetical protein IG631_09768 [Alternaria alternata]|nr:hypothetical protein IG631_09768 [Alternaria alternata]